jgi:serine phosphatase RsbU (regulator of sigma subunit)
MKQLNNLYNYIEATAKNNRSKDFKKLVDIWLELQQLDIDLDHTKYLLSESWKRNQIQINLRRSAELETSRLRTELEIAEKQINELEEINKKLTEGL